MGLKSIYLGIDLGTTTVKGLAMNDDGQVLANFLKETPLVSRQSDWAEQSPEFWWSSLLEIVNLIKTKVDLKQVQGIGLSGQMHGLVTYDSHFRALRRAIIWMDKRSSAEVEMILKNFGPKLYQITGNPIFTGFLLPSLIWIKKHEPHIYQKIHKISSPKDYLAYRLTEALRSEPTDALATAAFDYHKNTWSDKIISAGKLKRSLFPEIRSTLEPYGGVSEKIARITLIGDENIIHSEAEKFGLKNIKDAIIVNPVTYHKMDEFAQMLFEIRKNNGLGNCGSMGKKEIHASRIFDVATARKILHSD